jgi:hypothetical protein
LDVPSSARDARQREYGLHRGGASRTRRTVSLRYTMHPTMSHDHGSSMGNDDPAITPAAWANAIVSLDLRDRAQVLGKLLGFVGPLALAVLGGGAFGKYVRYARKGLVPVTLEDAARATVNQVQELVRYLQQSDPGVVLARQTPNWAALPFA